jgi:AraC-like DNA-binding protein
MGKAGRPRIEINADNFKDLCELQCTLSEIAGFFRCNESTIERWCKREYGKNFAEVYKMFSASGKISLRRWQRKAAKQGNAAVLIWLGRNELGQSENPEKEEAITEQDDALSASLRELGEVLESDESV